MRATSTAFTLGIGLLATWATWSTVPVLAHHSFTAEFDNSKPVTVKGKFTRLDWVNPHSWVHLDVTMSDGKVVNWGGETPPPNVLFRNGWKKDFLKVGDEIQVTGFAAKDGTPHMWASSVILVSTGQRILNMTPPPVLREQGAAK